MMSICCKHAQAPRTREKARRYPYVGLYVPQLSVCAIAGLGFGGNGTVYLAEECPTNALDTAPRQYAMKLITTKEHGSQCLSAYKQEYSYHTRIPPHPNVVRAYAMLETPGSLFLLFEYIQGADFYEFLKYFGHSISRNNSLIKALFLQLLDAVAHIHDQGIYHGDLKPENILCNHSNNCSRLMLADFGSSTDRPYIYHRNGYIHGTGPYISPECFPCPSGSGCVFPHAIDIWSLGIILFVICTGGQLPWQLAEKEMDARYREFCQKPDSIFEGLCFSSSVRCLLKTIWNPRPERRVNIHQLRSMVESTSEFTKYADQENVLRKANCYAVLQVYFWIAGRRKPRVVKDERVYSPESCKPQPEVKTETKAHSPLSFRKCLCFLRPRSSGHCSGQKKKSIFSWHKKSKPPTGVV